MEEGTASVRTLDGKVRQGVPLAEFKTRVLDHIARRRLNLELF